MKRKKYIIATLLVIIIIIGFYSVFRLAIFENNQEPIIDDSLINIDKDNGENDTTEEKISIRIISDFNQLLALNPSESELLNFIHLRASSINSTTLNKLIIKFINYQYEKLSLHDQMIQNDKIQKELIENFFKIISENDLEKLNDLVLRNRLMTLYRGGYSLEFNNGKYHLNINHNFFSQYEHLLTQEIKDFRIININLYNPNESITIQWEYIRQNIDLTEKFLNKYPNSNLYSKIYSHFITNVDYILYGTDYIDIFSEAGQLKEEIKEEYKSIMLNTSEYYFKETFLTYYNELINNGFILNDSIDKFRQEFFQSNIERYQKK